MVSAIKTNNGIDYSKGKCLSMADALRLDYPQLQHVARIYGRDNQQVTVLTDTVDAPQKKFKENVFFAEPDFFDIFHFPLLAGDSRTALAAVNNVVNNTGHSREIFWQLAECHGQIHQVQQCGR